MGETIREARLAHDLTFEEVERETRIRARYLAALEQERFDRLPGDAYGRSFLREYTAVLGLDPEPLVQEFDARVSPDDDAPPMLLPLPRRRRRWRTAIVVTGAVLLAFGLAWHPGGGHHGQRLAAAPPPSPLVGSKPESVRRAPKPRVVVGPPRLLLIATRGRCWLAVHAGSEQGPVLYEGTLEQGASLRLARNRLWIRLGAPWTIDLRLDDKPLALQSSSSPVNVLVTRTGVTAA